MKQKLNLKREVIDAIGCIAAFVFFFLVIFVFSVLFNG